MLDFEVLRAGERNVNSIRYADDIVLTAESDEKLQLLADSFGEECRRYGLSVNNQKAEMMGLTQR